MMDGAAEAQANGSDTADRSGTSVDPLSPREQLAGSLESLAGKLRKLHKRLTRTAPKGSQMAFWEEGLEQLQGHLEEVEALLEECQELIKVEVKDAEKKAQAAGLGHAELKAKPDKLSEALEQLDEAIILAHQKANAARGSLEMPDQDFSAQSRSKDFVEAAGQLKELALFCEATVVQLEGPAALVRQASAAQAQDTRS
jgi:hypothetical protein